MVNNHGNHCDKLTINNSRTSTKTHARTIRLCHTAAILSLETKKALFYHAKPHPHGFHCEAWRGKTKLFWSPGTIWPPCDKGELPALFVPLIMIDVTMIVRLLGRYIEQLNAFPGLLFTTTLMSRTQVIVWLVDARITQYH